MSAEHREVLERLGSYAIGALSAAEHDDVTWHLRDCPSCRAELAQVRRVADRILDLEARSGAPARPGPGLRAVPGPDPGAGDRLFARLARERRRDARRRTWTALSGAAAAAAVAVALVILGPLAVDRDQPPARAVAFEVVPVGVTASAEVRDWGWGTQMELVVDGLPGDQELTAWLERPDGTRVPAGSFRTTGDQVTMLLGAGANTTEAVALGVSDLAGATLLRAPLGG
jgi:anti-sigma factor RsiW